MMNRNILGFVAASLLIMASAAYAANKEETFSISPTFGGYTFDGRQHLDSNLLIGARVGYNFTKVFGVEALFDYVLPTDSTTGPMKGMATYRYGGEMLYHFFPDNAFVPYLAAGYAGLNFDGPDTRPRGAFDYGVGAKYFLKDNIAIRGDVRNLIYSTDRTNSNYEYTIGAYFAFGGATPAMKPVAKNEPEPIPPTPQPEPKVVEKVVIRAAEPKVEEKVVAAVVEKKAAVIVLAFEDVHFDFDKSTLTPEAKVILKRDIKHLKENPNAKIRVAGYTSASGTKEYNQKLSERRAKAVQEYLISEGVITRDRLSTIGYGETHPAVYEAAPKEIYSDAAKANMRVLFEIIVE